MGMTTEYRMGRIGDEDTFLKLNKAVKICQAKFAEYISDVEYEDGHDAIDDYAWHIVTPERFEVDWKNDERLKKTDKIKAKYKNLVKNNRVVFFEIDWN
jgi:hypothetical protein